MEFSALLRSQLAFFKPFVNGCSLATTRAGQDKLGELITLTRRTKVTYRKHHFSGFCAEWITPRQLTRRGVILYLHGGGYVAGNLEYAKGFGTVLAERYGIRVFCPAYRLAPEFPFPAAVEDACESFEYLLNCGFLPQEILLAGESAGGGLIFSLCLARKGQHKSLPAGILAISPWSDLTASGTSYIENKEKDPSMSLERLNFYANCYTKDRTNPLVSPLFGDLTGLPPCRIFVGGDEIMLDDARLLHQKLLDSNVDSKLTVSEGMWHGYLLYGIRETKPDFEQIGTWLGKVLFYHGTKTSVDETR